MAKFAFRSFAVAYSQNRMPLNLARSFSFSYCSGSFNHHQHRERWNKCAHDGQQMKENLEPSIGSPARIQKLIASQSDPLLAKEIFDLASRQPNFHHSYATFHTLILKLGRYRHFSLMESLLSCLRSHKYSISPSLFTRIIQVYGEAGLPEKALKTFYTILEFNIKPLPKHLNCILEILVARRNFLRHAFDLFRSAHKSSRRYMSMQGSNSGVTLLETTTNICHTLFDHENWESALVSFYEHCVDGGLTAMDVFP